MWYEDWNSFLAWLFSKNSNGSYLLTVTKATPWCGKCSPMAWASDLWRARKSGLSDEDYAASLPHGVVEYVVVGGNVIDGSPSAFDVVAEAEELGAFAPVRTWQLDTYKANVSNVYRAPANPAFRFARSRVSVPKPEYGTFRYFSRLSDRRRRDNRVCNLRRIWQRAQVAA